MELADMPEEDFAALMAEADAFARVAVDRGGDQLIAALVLAASRLLMDKLGSVAGGVTALRLVAWCQEAHAKEGNPPLRDGAARDAAP